MRSQAYPSLYQVNTRVSLTSLSASLGHRAILDDIPDQDLDRFVALGFEWIWLLSVWQTGSAGQHLSRRNPIWRKEFEETLSDLKDEDIGGSGFAIRSYTVSNEIGGEEALKRFRQRLSDRGLKLMLDFVPNHTAIDNIWVAEHPDFFIRGSEALLAREPMNYTRVETGQSDIVLAHGRDPYFPGWVDTLQLDYGNPDLEEAMKNELVKISGMCDGVRCDMAMLVLPEVFEKTWGIRCRPFWPDAIRRAKESNPSFTLMAEVYWDMEWTMIQQGFDYAYDKRLYDRLKEGFAKPVREHFHASQDYQSHMTRFLENHDEQRAAKESPDGKYQAAAVLTFLSPGMKFFHQGQMEGRLKKVSPHLVRAPEEPPVDSLIEFYEKLFKLLKMPVLRYGNWQLTECTQAWEGNRSFEKYIAFTWEANDNERILITVNYSSARGQCYVRIPFKGLENSDWILTDLYSGNSFVRQGDDLKTRGLYLDEPGWKIYIFSLGKGPSDS